MILKFLISPTAILTTILLIAMAAGALILLIKYLKQDSKDVLYENLEYLHKKTGKVGDGLDNIEADYAAEVARRKAKKKRRRRFP